MCAPQHPLTFALETASPFPLGTARPPSHMVQWGSKAECSAPPEYRMGPLQSRKEADGTLELGNVRTI